MLTLTTAMIAATATAEGIDLRTMTLLIGSSVVGVGTVVLAYIGCSGTQNQRLSTSVISGFVAFVSAYTFLDLLVVSTPSPAIPSPAPTHVPSVIPTPQNTHVVEGRSEHEWNYRNPAPAIRSCLMLEMYLGRW